MVLGKRVAIYDGIWGRNSTPREGQKIPLKLIGNQLSMVLIIYTKNASNLTSRY